MLSDVQLGEATPAPAAVAELEDTVLALPLFVTVARELTVTVARTVDVMVAAAFEAHPPSAMILFTVEFLLSSTYPQGKVKLLEQPSAVSIPHTQLTLSSLHCLTSPKLPV